jgi:hypothetical protein
MAIQLSRANSGKPLTTADYNSDNLIVETAVNSLLGSSSSGGTVTNITRVDTDTNSELFSATIVLPSSTPEITFSRISKAANLVYASPASGSAAKPTFRALVSGDLPVVPVDKGGTGLSTIQANKVLRGKGDGSAVEYAGIVPSVSARISVTPTTSNYELDIVPANIEIDSLAATTKLSIAKGGTGQGTAQAAINVLANVSISDAGKALIVNGSGNLVPTTFTAGVSSVNSLTGAVSLSTTAIPEGSNLYFTDTRVTNNPAVLLNTAKVTNATHTGDVTGNTALTIADNVVTYAKMQAISATKRLLGRITAGSGNTEEIAISGNLQMSSTDLIVKTSKVTTVTTSYTILNTDGTILVNASSRTITLPNVSTVSIGDEFIIKNIAGATSNTVRVFDTGNDLIDGETNYTELNHHYNCVTIKYGSPNRWYVINKITGG